MAGPPPGAGPGHVQAWTLVTASAAAFMTCLDTMVVTTALPVLQVSLHGTPCDLQ
jgi:hypothetical protein